MPPPQNVFFLVPPLHTKNIFNKKKKTNLSQLCMLYSKRNHLFDDIKILQFY